MPEETGALPSSVARRKRRISAVWLVPIVAVAAGLWVAVTRILDEGPEIEIVLHSAEGIEAGKTKIQYAGVEVGSIVSVRLSEDHRRVITKAQMAPKTEGFLVDDTQFWVVKPRISGSSVSGLGTLLSGSYLGMSIGHSKQSKRKFVALEEPPVVTPDVAGRFFDLKTDNLGSLDQGTPIYFRRLKVGEVASYKLEDDGVGLIIKVFVNAPYDQYVTSNTRFWHASGIDVTLTASGLSVQTQSLLSILVGGVAFETPPVDPIEPPADENAVFTLFSDRNDAFKLPPKNPENFLLVFDQSVRGLTIGAPVEMRGVPVGEVVDIGAQLDATTMDFSAPVTIDLDAERLGVKIVDIPADIDPSTFRQTLIDKMVQRGVRAQLRTGNLLTGGLYVSFDVFPDAPPATVDWSQKPVRLPTVPGELESLEASVVSIIKKLDQLPYQEIGEDLRKAMASLDQTLVSTQDMVESADKLIEPNSLLTVELDKTLQEVTRAARALRVLADYLERHPESLIRGKPGEAK